MLQVLLQVRKEAQRVETNDLSPLLPTGERCGRALDPT